MNCSLKSISDFIFLCFLYTQNESAEASRNPVLTLYYPEVLDVVLTLIQHCLDVNNVVKTSKQRRVLT